MRVSIKTTIIALALVSLAWTSTAGADVKNNTDLEMLLYSEITVTSIKALTLRDSPGIVSLITAEEINKSGARDLIDVLRLVPGLEFGVDCWSVIGLSVRGNWAHEGKVSLMIDGLEMAELLYSTLQFANHFPIDQIKQIEIIRGPGSAVYGGMAELAVINIVTKKAVDLDGGRVTATLGQLSKTFGRRNLSLAFGKELTAMQAPLSLSGSVAWGEANLSDRQFTDAALNTYDLTDNSRFTPLNINLDMKYQGWETRVLVDQYHYTERDEFGTDILEPLAVDFNSYFLDVSYTYQEAKLSIIPRFRYKRQIPWKKAAASNGLSDYAYNKFVERYSAGLMAAYDPIEQLNLIYGITVDLDHAQDELEGSASFDGNKDINYANAAGYLQSMLQMAWFNTTLGVRYENHSAYGSSFVPRLGLTRVIDAWHIKLLASKAFRAPNIENIRANPEIKAENTTVFEFESGYQFSPNIFITGNLFDITLDKPIVYSYDEVTGADLYLNYDLVRTRGWELEFRIKEAWGYATLNYSYYTVVENHVAQYQVPERSDLLLGTAPSKATANISVNLIPGVSVNPSAIYLSERFGGYTYAENGELLIQRYAPVMLLNVYLDISGFFMKNLDCGLGVNNLLNSEYLFIQPYNGGHPPLAGPSREYLVKLSYKF